MVHTVGRLGWLTAAVLGGFLLSTGVSRGQDEEATPGRAAFEKGLALQQKGRLKEAAASYEQALELASRAYGDDEHTASILCYLANVYKDMGQYDKAEPLFKRSLKIYEDKHGKDHPDAALLLNNLALLYEAMGQYAKAEPLFQRSLRIREAKRPKDHPDVAQSLVCLANLYQDMGQYTKAEPLYLRGLQILENIDKDSTDVAMSLNDLANLYQSMGQYAKAEPLFQRSLQIREDKLGKEHLVVAWSLNNLASLYQAMGQYAKAEPLFLRSLQIKEDKLGKEHPDVAGSLGNLATLYKDMGQYDKAEPLMLRSLKIREDKLGKDHPDVAASLNNLADLYLAMGQYDKAEPLYLRSIKIKEDNLGKDHPDVAASLNNLAILYDRMGQYDKAEPLHLRSLKIKEDKLGKDHPDVAVSLNNLALLYVDMGQEDKAEPLYLRCLQIYEDKLGKDHPDVARSLNNLAGLYARQGRWKEAVKAADEDRRVLRRHVARVLPALLEKEQLTFLEHNDALAFDTAESLALGRRGDAATAALSAGWVLNGKAVAHEALAQRALAALDAKDPAARDLSQQLLGVRSRRAALSQAAAQAGQEDQRRKELDDFAAQEQDLSERLAKVGGHSQRAEPWVELAEVRKALPADAVLIEISRFWVLNFERKGKDKEWLGYHYAAWVIAAEGDVHVIDLGPADAIDDAVKAVRQAITDAQGSPQHPSTITQDGEPEAEKALLKPMRELSKLVLEPLAEHIDGKTRWYVSPDAALWLVPWAALPLKDGRYAVEAHTISYLVSGRDLVATPSQAKPGRPRLMADPDYDLGLAEARAAAAELVGKPEESDPGLTLRGLPAGLTLGKAPRLPGTAAEAKAIKPALEKYAGEEAWLYQQDKALESVFKKFRGPRVLVLSTHGFFLPDQEVAPSDKIGTEEKRPALDKDNKPLENPLLRCGLLLAGCNNRDQAKEGDEDGVLTGLEVVGTDLRGTDLVVLSACETGLGDVHNGEGVAGLRQAFQLGARAVAATLWQIPDRESAKLMGDFFAHLADGQGKAEALREAQLAMIQARRDKNAAAHPFFWAAFTLTGQ